MTDKEHFADLEQMKVDILKEKILSGLQEFKDNPKQQWTAPRLEKPLLERLLSLIKQAEQVEELESRNKELEYAAKYNGDLNEFLQKRKLPPNTLGSHVVDVVMDYVEKLEKTVKTYQEAKDWLSEVEHNVNKIDNLLKENKRYKQALEFYADRENYEITGEKTYIGHGDFTEETWIEVEQDRGEKARQALEEETE